MLREMALSLHVVSDYVCVRALRDGLGVLSLLPNPVRTQPTAARASSTRILAAGPAPVPPRPGPLAPPRALPTGRSPASALAPKVQAAPRRLQARPRSPRLPRTHCPRLPQYSPKKKKKRQKAFAKIMLNKSHSFSVFLPWIKNNNNNNNNSQAVINPMRRSQLVHG